MEKSLEERAIELAVERKENHENNRKEYLLKQKELAIDYFSKSIPEAKYNEQEDKFDLGDFSFSYGQIYFGGPPPETYGLFNPRKYERDYHGFRNSDIYNLADFGEFLQTELEVKGK